jgi:hypothetical protein
MHIPDNSAAQRIMQHPGYIKLYLLCVYIYIYIYIYMHIPDNSDAQRTIQEACSILAAYNDLDKDVSFDSKEKDHKKGIAAGKTSLPGVLT